MPTKPHKRTILQTGPSALYKTGLPDECRFKFRKLLPFALSMSQWGNLASAGNHQIWRKCLLQVFWFPKEKKAFVIIFCAWVPILLSSLPLRVTFESSADFKLNLKMNHRFQDTKFSASRQPAGKKRRSRWCHQPWKRVQQKPHSYQASDNPSQTKTIQARGRTCMKHKSIGNQASVIPLLMGFLLISLRLFYRTQGWGSLNICSWHPQSKLCSQNRSP